MNIVSVWQTRIIVFGGALLLSAAASSLLAAPSDPDYTEPLGIALESWPYPYPVQYYSLVVDGQLVRMAYMAIEPAGTPLGWNVMTN